MIAKRPPAPANEWAELEAACGDAISALTHLEAFFAQQRMRQATPVVLEPESALKPAGTPETADKWLTPLEVADLLRVKESTVRSWLRSGKLEGFNVGFTWRIPLAALDKKRKGEGEV